MMTIKTTKKMVTSAILFSSLLGATVVSSVTSVTTANAAEVTTTAKASDTSSMKMMAKHSATATKQVAAVTVTQNIAYGVDWLKNTLDHASLDAWDAVALNQSGLSDAWTATDAENNTTDLKSTIITNIEKGYSDGASLAENPQTTNYERDILGLLAAGYSVDQLTAVPSTTNDSTTNLVSLMIDGLNGSPDVYALSYGIAALTSMKLANDNDSTYDENIATAVDSLITLQGFDAVNNQDTDSGYWMDAYGGITDVNGMVFQALAPYATGKLSVSGYTSEDILTSLTQAANAITNTENGFLQADGNIYDSNSLYGEANSSSNSMVLAGLTACGITLTDSTGASINDKIAAAILTYQVAQGETDAGSFNWASDATYDRHLSTQQGTYGLDQYNNGSAKWLFDFTSTN